MDNCTFTADASGIQEVGSLIDQIRYVCTFNDSFPNEAFTKEQLGAMIDEIRVHANEALRILGIADLEKHFGEVWPNLGLNRSRDFGNDRDSRYHPYAELSEDEEAALPAHS